MVVFGIWFGLSTLNLSESIKGYIDKGNYILITLATAWFLSRLLDSVVVKYLKPIVKESEGNLDDQLLPIIRKGLKLTIWSIAILVALNNAGYNIGALLAGLGIGGLAFAMAAKDTVANLFGSFTIFVDKPFMVGDRIESNGFDGTVQEIGIRSTKIKTLAGRIVTIANADVANNPIENISSEPSRKVVSTLGLTYDMSAKKIELAIQTLRDISALNKSIEENITVGFSSFGDFSLNILYIYYIKSGEDIMGTQTSINLAILREFGEKGLDMAFPTQTIITQNS